MAEQLQDSFNRKFYYLRLSITDVCNFRCTYCLPDGYRPHQTKNHFLNLNELRQVVTAFAACGTSKIRLTGGEPTLRKDFNAILAMIAEQPEIEKIALTTNGYRLERDVKTWRALGLTQLNVSVDSLDPRKFYQITGENKFHHVMAGIDAAFDAGYSQVKVNAVLLKDFNCTELPAFLAWIKRRPIQLRFIELMQTGEMDSFFNKHHQSGLSIRHYLIANGWILKAKAQTDGPAEIYAHSDYLGEIGLIMPYSKNFCASCNRLRVSAIGKLHLCLFGEHGVALRDLLQDSTQQSALIERLQLALIDKKQRHHLDAGHTGMTPHLAAIGG